jgi:hypothetical protein
MNRQHIWERGDNEMRNQKISASLQNDTTEFSRKEQMIISRLRTGYTRATHRHVIDTPNCQFCDVRLTTDHILWQCDKTRNTRGECRIRSTIWKEGREGNKKLIDYVRKIGFYHGILKSRGRSLSSCNTIEKRKM